MITDFEIKDALYKKLKSSDLAAEVTGTVNKRKRPKDSDKEDIIISVVTNQNGQKQEAVANVNIYVADDLIDGQYEEAGPRCKQLSILAEKLLDQFFIDGVKYHLDSQHSIEVEATHEHVINNRLSITKINE